MEPGVIASNAVYVIPMKSLVTFGFLQSKVFSVWNKAVSGRMKSDTRISATITYNTFVAPLLSEESRALIVAGAEGVLAARSSFPDNSLGDLYDSNSMPPNLRKAHDNLDATVLRTFGLAAISTDDEILAALFQRYEEATSGLLAKS
jgi:hypothetical protein